MLQRNELKVTSQSESEHSVNQRYRVFLQNIAIVCEKINNQKNVPDVLQFLNVA